MPTPRPTRRILLRGACCVGAIGLVCAAWAGWLLRGDRAVGRHPVFGSVYATVAYDLNEGRQNPVGRALRAVLPEKITRSPRFPARFKDQPKYLDVGGVPMEWSLGGPRTGWLYYWDPESSPRQAAWEFAPAAETSLAQVSAVPGPEAFRGPADPRGLGVFGEGSSPNAIKVAVGQVLFARRGGDPGVVYVLRIAEQRGNRMTAHYCVQSRPPPRNHRQRAP